MENSAMKFDAVKELELILDVVRDQGGTISRAHEDHAIRMLEEKIRADERANRPEEGERWVLVAGTPEGYIITQSPGQPIYCVSGDRWYRLDTPPLPQSDL